MQAIGKRFTVKTVGVGILKDKEESIMLRQYFLRISKVLYDNNLHCCIMTGSNFIENHTDDYFFKKIDTRDFERIDLIMQKNKNKSFKTIKEALKYFELFEHLI